MTCRLGTYLSVKVNLDAAVDGDEIVDAGNNVNIIYVVYRRTAANRVIVDEII